MQRLIDMTSSIRLVASKARAQHDGFRSIEGEDFVPTSRVDWKTNEQGMTRLKQADRIELDGQDACATCAIFDDFPVDSDHERLGRHWRCRLRDEKIYVVQTATKVVERCILMATDPGDLVLDPTCGSGTTAYVAEQWGRRWITIDTSRVALALARARIMGARYPYYLLADSQEGQRKEAEVTRTVPSEAPDARRHPPGLRL